MNGNTLPSLRRVGAAAGLMFVLVLLTIGVQMARGHDPAIGTTPKRSATAASQPVGPVAPDVVQPQYQYQQPQYQYQQPEYQQPQYQQQQQLPPVQTTTS